VEKLSEFVQIVRRVCGNLARRLCRGHGRSSRRPVLEHLEPRWTPSTTNGSTSISSNFNGTSISAGDTIWFTSDFKVNGLGHNQVILNFTDSSISYTANGVNYTVDTPDAEVILSPTATTATTTFNSSLNEWVTTLPMNFSGNGFLDAVELHLGSSLPGGIKNVTWQGTLSTDTQGVSVNWQWAAAVYTNFSSDYNALDVKPTDDNHVSTYHNSDHAGTPEAFLSYVVGGATGGGGSNFTGSLSGTASVVATTSATLSGYVTDTFGNPISGVVLTLTTTIQGQQVTVTATTDSSGFYDFTGLQAGTYSLTATAPSGDQSAGSSAGTVNGKSSGSSVDSGTIGGIGLTAGSVGRDFNFQEQLFAGSI
jgi:hypothetical protein